MKKQEIIQIIKERAKYLTDKKSRYEARELLAAANNIRKYIPNEYFVEGNDECKDKAIQIIEGLYPADSQYPSTKAIGEMLMMKAMKDMDFDWRDLPLKVLKRYAEDCIERDKLSFN